MSAVLTINSQTIPPEELLPLLAQYRLLPHLAREIIIDQAIADIDCTPAELAQVRQQLLEQYQLMTDSQLEAWLQQQEMTREQLEYQLERKLKLDKFKQATWGKKLEAYFIERKRQLDCATYSLIRVQDEGVANELYFRLQEGESTFSELAQKYSQGPEAQTGGLIGPVEISTLHPQISQLLCTSQTGELRFPISVEGWWAIVRLEKFISAQLDESMRQRLLDEQFQAWLLKQIQQKVSLD